MEETTLLYHCRALCMDEADTLLDNAFVVVQGATIRSVGTERPAGEFTHEIDCGGNVLMPGLVNAHTHIPMTLLRGYGGGCDLQTWLNDWIFPAEAKLDDRAVKAGAGLALAELIASGVTTIADMYMHTPAIAETVLQAGISANLSCGGVYFGAPADFSPKTCNDCGNQIRLTEEWHGAGDGQILVDASIHAEYTSNVPLWQWMAQYAQDHKLGMHVHLSETQHEHEACQERWGLTPFGILDKFGVWNTRAIAAHCVWTTEEDWAGMAAKGVSCVHNPVSNLKLGSGVAWIPAMKKAGVGLAVLSGPIIQMLYPETNQEIASHCLMVLGIASAFVCMMLLCNAILQANGRAALPIWFIAIGSATKLIVNFILVQMPSVGIKGAPVGTLVCFMLVSVMELIAIKRVTPHPPKYLRVFVKPVLAAAIMGAAARAAYGILAGHLGNTMSVAGGIVVGAIVYAILVLVLRIVSKDDLSLMPKGDKIAKLLHIK